MGHVQPLLLPFLISKGQKSTLIGCVIDEVIAPRIVEQPVVQLSVRVIADTDGGFYEQSSRCGFQYFVNDTFIFPGKA